MKKLMEDGRLDVSQLDDSSHGSCISSGHNPGQLITEAYQSVQIFTELPSVAQ